MTEKWGSNPREMGRGSSSYPGPPVRVKLYKTIRVLKSAPGPSCSKLR